MALSSFAKRGLHRVAPSIAVERERLQDMEKKLRRVSRELARTRKTVEQLRGEVTELRTLQAADPIARLRALTDRVEHYQPLYGLPDVLSTPARPSHDRAPVIADRLGELDGLRVLDVGSSLGFMSMYLADRGATVLGWEMNARNLEVAREVAGLTGVPVEFAMRMLTVDSVDVAVRWRPDAVLLLSVLHHVVYYQGLDAAQEVLRRLAATAPLLIVELARGDEDPALPWSASQPSDPYEVFATIEGGYDVEVLGAFPTHLSTTARDLVAILPRRASEAV